jgi:hypothetical protein
MQVRIHYNGWKSSFDEVISISSYRIKPPGSRSPSKRDDGVVPLTKKDTAWKCLHIPARTEKRIKITPTDWCIDYTDANRPVLWLLSKDAWYKVSIVARMTLMITLCQYDTDRCYHDTSNRNALCCLLTAQQ